MTGSRRDGPRRRRSMLKAATLATSVITAAVTAALQVAIPDVALAQPVPASLIVSNPEPGWQLEPSGAMASIVDRMEKVDSNAVDGANVQVAVRVWESPGGDDLLAVTVSEWPPNVDNLDQVMREGLDDECVSVTGNNPPTVSPVANLNDSLNALCASPGGGPQLAAAIARRGAYLEMVESVSAPGRPTLGLAAVDSLATTQYSALPASSIGLADVAMGGIVVMLLVGVPVAVVLIVRRRRGQRAEPQQYMAAPLAYAWSGAPTGGDSYGQVFVGYAPSPPPEPLTPPTAADLAASVARAMETQPASQRAMAAVASSTSSAVPLFADLEPVPAPDFARDPSFESVIPESTIPESVIPESTIPESVTPESVTPEAAIPEATIPGFVAPESVTPEFMTPEFMTPESTIPEFMTPEFMTPESVAPESVTPESVTRESGIPESGIPESVTPESVTPEFMTPESVAPEFVTPVDQTIAPQEAAPALAQREAVEAVEAVAPTWAGEVSPDATTESATEVRSAGWHQDGDSPALQHYWNGKAWIARVRWDGSTWVRLNEDGEEAKAHSPAL